MKKRWVMLTIEDPREAASTANSLLALANDPEISESTRAMLRKRAAKLTEGLPQPLTPAYWGHTPDEWGDPKRVTCEKCGVDMPCEAWQEYIKAHPETSAPSCPEPGAGGE